MIHFIERLRDFGYQECNTREKTGFSGKVMRGLACRKSLSDQFWSVGWL